MRLEHCVPDTACGLFYLIPTILWSGFNYFPHFYCWGDYEMVTSLKARLGSTPALDGPIPLIPQSKEPEGLRKPTRPWSTGSKLSQTSYEPFFFFLRSIGIKMLSSKYQEQILSQSLYHKEGLVITFLIKKLILLLKKHFFSPYVSWTQFTINMYFSSLKILSLEKWYRNVFLWSIPKLCLNQYWNSPK